MRRRPVRRGRPRSAATAVSLIRIWLRYPVQSITVTIMSDALTIRAAAGLSYWDAAIVAAARAHGQIIAGVTIVNPFR